MMETAKSGSAVGFLLARAHGVVRQKMVAALEGSGLHLGHIAILGRLAQGGSTQAALCGATGIEKSSMVLFVDALEQGGWVERQRHPADRRAYQVVLTSAGQDRLAELGPRLATAEQEALAALSPGDQERLAEILRRLVDGRQ